MTRLLPVNDSVESVRNAMDKDIYFANLVISNIEDDEMYWYENLTEDFIYNTEVKGFRFDASRKHVVIYDFEQFTKTFKDCYAPAWIDRYFPNDLWERYTDGAIHRDEFFYAINLACKVIEDDYKEEVPKHMLTDGEFIQHGVDSGYYNNYYIDTQTGNVVNVFQEYSKDLDMTLIFRHTKSADGTWNDAVKEIVNYYYGRPNDDDLDMYYQ